MKKTIVVIPLDTLEDDLRCGRTYQFLEDYYNPDKYFDEVYCLGCTGKTFTVGNVNYINAEPREFKDIISKIQPDIIRAYGGFSCCDWASANRVKDIPLVISVHDTNPNLINQSLKYADYVICMSEEVKKVVKSQVNVSDEQIYMLPNRVDTDRFCRKYDKKLFSSLCEKYGDGKHIIHVGRKTTQKNLDTLIKAMKYLPEYSALFIGPGVSEPYEKLAVKCKVRERCHFIDHMENGELPIIYSWGDCMCTPSRWEGFGIVFIEAAACECSIVTSNIAPINEFLKNKENAILVDDYENPKVLAEEIAKVCAETEENKRMKKNARKVALRFDKNKIDKLEVKLYEKIITNGTDNKKLIELEKEREKLKKPVIIFGAGIIGRRLLNYVGKEGVSYFVDNDKSKHGEIIDGVEVISYNDLRVIHEKYNVVVSPVNRKEIIEQLKSDRIEYMEEKWYRLLKQQID